MLAFQTDLILALMIKDQITINEHWATLNFEL